MLPDELLSMLTTDSLYGLTVKDAKTLLLLDDRERLDYYLDVVAQVQNRIRRDAVPGLGAIVGNW
jgi:aspartyl-tRNA(Asn)/glutamyl-tRNA(Gln) amidotransferase subunit B